jgi:putative transposase
LLLAEYFNYYNIERRHTGIDDMKPEQLYYQLNKNAAQNE